MLCKRVVAGRDAERTAACPMRRNAVHGATNLDAWQQLFFGQGEEHTCLVKDFSDEGVRFQVNNFEIPDDFALRFAPDAPAQSGHYKLVWRIGNDVGAKFIGPEPADRNPIDW
jgi:hypothetical protein